MITANFLDHLLTSQKNQPLLISIAGSSAVGKTSVVSQQLTHLIEQHSQLQPVILNQDNFQLGKTFSKTNNSPYRFDDPGNFDLPACYQVLSDLLHQQPSQIPQFSFQENQRISSQVLQLSANSVLIFEGLYAFYNQALAEIADYKIFVQAPFYARLLRRIFRFIYKLKIKTPDLARALEQMVLEVQPANQSLVSLQKKVADLIITSSYNFEETFNNFNLAQKTIFTTPTGETLWSIKPEPNLELNLIKTPHSQIYFNVLFQGQNFYSTATSEAVAQNLSQIAADEVD